MSDIEIVLDNIDVCTVVLDETPYVSSGNLVKKNELMVVSGSPKWNHDFISLAKFIVLGNGNADIRIIKMPFSEFRNKVDQGHYRFVGI